MKSPEISHAGRHLSATEFHSVLAESGKLDISSFLSFFSSFSMNSMLDLAQGHFCVDNCLCIYCYSERALQDNVVVTDSRKNFRLASVIRTAAASFIGC